MRAFPGAAEKVLASFGHGVGIAPSGFSLGCSNPGGQYSLVLHAFMGSLSFPPRTHENGEYLVSCDTEFRRNETFFIPWPPPAPCHGARADTLQPLNIHSPTGT